MCRDSICLLMLLSSYWALVGRAAAADAAADRLLVHWTFEQDESGTVSDLSGNGLDGRVTAERVAAPGGKAARMDGTPRSLVTLQVPEDKRFGRGSWSFLAMVKPTQFRIDDPQNQRRIFNYGVYPTANLVIDIGGDGRLMCYFCYRDAAEKTRSVGGSASVALQEGVWAHVALVCDRENRRIEMYVNGFTAGGGTIPDDFAGDFSEGGQLTVGSSWHNYLGLVDEVKIYRSALAPQTVESEFERLRERFEVVESEPVRAGKRRLRLERQFAEISTLWAKGRFEDVRARCREVVTRTDAAAPFRSYAHLRIAQSFEAERDLASARTTYAEIAATGTYPEVHRYEATESARELARAIQGLPRRDPAASRTKIPEIGMFAAEVFVDPAGNDGNIGSQQKPFATLGRARDAVRALKGRGVTGPIAVTVLPGRYELQNTIALTAQDSGTEHGPVVYRAREQGTAVLYGGQRLTGWQPVSDPDAVRRLPDQARDKVWQCNLKALGIEDYGELKVRGFAQPPSPPTLELYVDRVPMTLARWPNSGFVGIRQLVQPGSRASGEPSVFEYESDRHARWTEAPEPWLFGYFHFLWADATIRVAKIDTANRTITTAEPYHYGGRGMSTVQGIQYYAFNLLEEIDRPGEWYCDRTTGILYLYPAADPREATIEIPMLAQPMLTLSGVEHVRVAGLVFDLARYNGIVLADCRDCTVLGCTVSRLAGNGVMVHGGQRNRLIGCHIHTIGRRATEVIGGDRETLTPGQHLVENCCIHDFGRIDRTYTPAIQLEGVGHRVAHNLMYNGPSSAMRIEGNEHLIEYNEVHDMVRESDDQGGLELFGNPSYRGVVFRYNYLHDVGKAGPGKAVHGQAAIRFDDAISGMLVYGNVFCRSANGNFGAVQMNSGRDNLMDNNLFIECQQGISGGWYPNNNVWKMLREGQTRPGIYQSKLYLDRYPQMATMLDDHGTNRVWRNVFYRCGRVATRTANLDLFQNGVYEDEDPGFVGAESGDFRLRDDAPLFQAVGFKPIPVEEIGLYDPLPQTKCR